MKLLWARFWFVLDEEGIALFQYILGVAFIAYGCFGLLLADQRPPVALGGSMTERNTFLWYVMFIAGPLCCLVGRSLTGDLTYAGRLMQLAGDFQVALVLLGYITGTIEASSVGFGSFMGSALLFLMRDVRRLRAVERRIHQ